MNPLFELPVKQVPGVGAKNADKLAALGIGCVAELLDYYPFRYEDYRVRELRELQDGDRGTVQGTVAGEPVLSRFGRAKSRLVCRLLVDGQLISAVWFNRPFLKEQLTPGRELAVTGKWERRRKQLTVTESEFADSRSSSPAVQPVYSVMEGISQKWMRKVIGQALEQFGSMIPEIMPQELVDKHELLPRLEAVRLIHMPGDPQAGQEARRRLVYEELFLFQLKLHALRAIARGRADGSAHPVDRELVRRFVRTLPFKLTESQKQVIAELLQDLQAPYAMNRLLQGDVGSGKTVVAAVALLAAVKAGYQGALMVPTEILAEQHMRSLQRLYEGWDIETALLTGSLGDRARRDVLASLQMGLTHIVVGTHALIQEDVAFRKLGLVVTDEQHRFGVNQRSILRRKGMNPDVLTMTATPIPRTLAITAFGDMDVSTLKELPGGRKPILTYTVSHSLFDRVVGFMAKELAQGRQAYVICPLIEESEKLDVQNAIDLHERLRAALPDYRVGLLHGRMPAQEKEETMREFKDNRIHALVSTTVIEVGVDVPNATVMVVHDADRFGLAQLHQLRGRVGRGSSQSYCILVADPKSETGKERLAVMTETNDGFEIARRDLELRGPGDFFGTKQSGLPEFRLADLTADFETLEQARDDAAELVARSEFWTDVRFGPLRDYLRREGIFGGDRFD